MKKEYFKTADSYMSPKIDVLRISIEGLLCGSLGGGNSGGMELTMIRSKTEDLSTCSFYKL